MTDERGEQQGLRSNKANLGQLVCALCIVRKPGIWLWRRGLHHRNNLGQPSQQRLGKGQTQAE
jgi:hypothetical protein